MHRMTLAMMLVTGLVTGAGHGQLQGMAGPRSLVGGQSAIVDILLRPETVSVGIGETFTLEVRVEANGQPVTGIGVFLNFDAAVLQVQDADNDPSNGVQVSSGVALPIELLNRANNGSGHIDFSAGTLATPHPSGTFIAASITFKAITPTAAGGTVLDFSTEGVRKTDADFGGVSVLGEARGATILVTGTSGNSAPVAKDSTYTVDEADTLTVGSPGVLANDVDPDGDVLTAILVSDVSNGTLALSPDGAFSYAPNVGFSGIDTFTYRANDGTLDSNIASVTVTVYAVGTADSPSSGRGEGGTSTDEPDDVTETAGAAPPSPEATPVPPAAEGQRLSADSPSPGTGEGGTSTDEPDDVTETAGAAPPSPEATPLLPATGDGRMRYIGPALFTAGILLTAVGVGLLRRRRTIAGG